ncbi:restriction endonuclease subunit S [Pseudoalteromonas sp. SA25]|uniref:restriction endonuclease subunit S n=1 Tax=Pseudoalteromonas sp. SA25 TaxID=2686347 RepID=UPI0013FD9BC4
MSFFGNQSNWQLRSLKEIATLKRGYDLPTKLRTAGKVPIYAANGQNGSHNEAKIKGPGVITGRSGTIGKVHYTNTDYWPLNTSLYVTNFHGNDPKWVFYMLKAFQLERFVEGAGVPTLNRNLVHDELIPLPPLHEQKRIAAILDKADTIRRKRQQAIQLADDFLRSVFLDMFGDPVTNPKGWELKPLASLCRKITDGTHHSPPIVEKGVPYVTAKHLKKTGLEFHAKPWYVSEEEHKKIFSRCNPEKNDVLYIKDGATTGLAAINEYGFEFSMLSSLALLKPNFELVNSEFLCMFLNHPRTKLVLTANMAGAAITRLTLAKIKDVQVPLPDINTQEKFKEVYLSVRALSNKVKASDGLSEQEFNSLSQKAFAGQL